MTDAVVTDGGASRLPEIAPTIRVTAMPGDANPYGDIFGGWLMGQMDLAAGSVASRHAEGRAVTIACDAMKFHAPVLVGDEVSVYATLIAVGRTSMTIEVEAWRRARHAEDACKVTQARFVFVATDEHRALRTVAPLPSAGAAASTTLSSGTING